MMTSFYSYDKNPSGLCFLVQIRAFVIETSLGLPNKNMKGKTKRILVVAVNTLRTESPSHLGKIEATLLAG